MTDSMYILVEIGLLWVMQASGQPVVRENVVFMLISGTGLSRETGAPLGRPIVLPQGAGYLYVDGHLVVPFPPAQNDRAVEIIKRLY